MTNSILCVQPKLGLTHEGTTKGVFDRPCSIAEPGLA
jgi:hypothetical protein